MKNALWVLIACIQLFLGCAPMVEKRNDPLIGKIYDTGLKREIEYQELLREIQKAEVIYLGENHDNADHHEIQLRILQDLLQAGKRPQIGFEFFSSDQTGYLMAFVRLTPKRETVEHTHMREKALRRKLGWEESEDRSWSFYYRLIDLAREKGLTAFGTDLPKGIVRRIVKTGIEGLTPVERNWIQSTGFDDPMYKKVMLAKFADVHCGFSHPKMSERLYQAWVARNDAMARSIASMVRNAEKPVVVIVGGGHTQYNMGIYERVAHLKPQTSQINVGIQEVALHPLPLEDYMRTVKMDGRTFPPSHSYLWFTQRNSHENPCEKFQAHLQKMKRTKRK